MGGGEMRRNEGKQGKYNMEKIRDKDFCSLSKK